MSGLADIIACESSICSIENGVLCYRGFSIDKLAENASFEEVIYLLWHGRLPNKIQLDTLRTNLIENAVLPEKIYNLLSLYAPWGNCMAKLRTAVSFLTHFDDNVMDPSPDADSLKAIRIISKFTAIIAAIDRIRNSLEPVDVTTIQPTSLAELFLWLLTGEKPSEIATKALDKCLILHAEHELNASTFAARVTVSTMSDMYSGIVSAIGTLKGPLHGNANEQVANMLEAIGDVDQVEAYITEKINNKGRIMGFGHRVYKHGDPRAKHLQKLAHELAEWQQNTHWYDISIKIAEIVKERKGLLPNVDFFSASVYTYIGIPRDMFTLVFALSRSSGWIAHILEQHANNKLIRPRAHYIGKRNAVWLPLEDR
ncbi:MAG: citrate synthase [Firmicutes bacterium]|nr:citrate synthase [Bacillota bacterium]